jgi:hypothetical protein
MPEGRTAGASEPFNPLEYLLLMDTDQAASLPEAAHGTEQGAEDPSTLLSC